VTLYLPDTLLSEIRNDVIHSTTFDYLDDPTLQENDTQKTLQIVNDKWIVQIGALQRDLELIIRNLQHVDAKNESIQTWQDYIVKINEFRKIWNTKSVELVETWISTRRKRKGVSK
jgi:esterase/lipase